MRTTIIEEEEEEEEEDAFILLGYLFTVIKTDILRGPNTKNTKNYS